MNKSKRWTDEQLIEAVRTNTSIRQVLISLGLASQGGSYRTIHNAVKRLNLDTSHWTGKVWNKGKVLPKRPIEDYLSNKQFIKSHSLRLRLIKDGIFDHICSNCNLTSWNNLPIPLELEHKDGNHRNNSLDNLCLLCPNCHAQTVFYRGRAKRKNYISAGKIPPLRVELR